MIWTMHDLQEEVVQIRWSSMFSTSIISKQWPASRTPSIVIVDPMWSSHAIPYSLLTTMKIPRRRLHAHRVQGTLPPLELNGATTTSARITMTRFHARV